MRKRKVENEIIVKDEDEKVEDKMTVQGRGREMWKMK